MIPTRDRPEWLQEAVASVLAQTIRDFELIVVNDGGSPVELPDDPRVRELWQEGRGPAAARNAGIRESRGDYVCFLDDDDLYKPDRLFLGMQSAPFVVVGQVGMPSFRPRRLLVDPVPNVGQVTIRRELCPPFDERFRASEDVEWWVRAGSLGPVPALGSGLIRRDHEGRSRVSTSNRRRLAARLRLLAIHKDFFSLRPSAAAHQWKRVGGLALVLGRKRLARFAFLRSLRLRADPRTMVHLIRTLV